MTRTTVIGGLLLLLTGCSSADVTTSVEPLVHEVSFSPGCGAKTDVPDCSFGFVMTYAAGYADVETTVTHVTDNAEHTVEITVDAWSSSHTPSEAEARDADLGLLDAVVGQTYKVTVVDRKHAVLWSGKVDTVYHL